jgi:hypothetical protein
MLGGAPTEWPAELAIALLDRQVARRHKDEMRKAIANMLPPSRSREKDAEVTALAVDGAIVRAQLDETPDAALKTLDRLVKALRAPGVTRP